MPSAYAGLSALAAAEPLAAATLHLARLPVGTRLRVAIGDGKLTLSAAGMPTIALSLLDDGTELVVDGGLNCRLADVAESVVAAYTDNDPLPNDPWFWVSACLLAAGNSGVSL